MKTTVRKYRTPDNCGINPGEPKNEGKVLVVTGQSYSIRELLQRFANGTAPAVLRAGSYSNPENFNDEVPQIKDLTDLDNMKIFMKDIRAQLDAFEAEKRSQPVTPPASNEGQNNKQ